jgi:hypothetical protein
MSKNEEEQGQLLLPSSAVVAVRRALVEAENQHRAQALVLAQKVHAYLSEKVPSASGGRESQPRLVALRKALRSNQRFGPGSVEDCMDKAFAAVQGPVPRESSFTFTRSDGAMEAYHGLRHAATSLVLPYPSKPGETRAVRAPRKSALSPVPMSTQAFSNGACSIRIDPATRTLHWDVDRSSHAVDRARDSYLGRALFQALAKVAWTRGTGGVFRSSDEYGEEAAMEHGGNPVNISSHFGPLGEKEFEAHSGYNPRTMKIKAFRR